MFLIRQAGPDDFPGVFALARLLDSYNLPADRGYIRELLQVSEESFAGRLPRSKARYLFVLEEKGQSPLEQGQSPLQRILEGAGAGTVPAGTVPKIVGCSLIIAKHGTPGRPHLWLGLESITKRSRTLGIRRTHPVLRLGFTEDGPTEVGGLVVLPRYRKHPEQCGLQISYVRFLYMAMHPDRFENKILVEYRGAMRTGNQSPFWEAMGRVFTGLPYGKADRLSVSNKEFIRSLFPREPIYCALLPKSVRAAIGAIHPAAQRAAALLRGIGFKPMDQIEPFDGGPYYSAARAKVRLIRRTKRLRVAANVILAQARIKSDGSNRSYLVGTEVGGFFRAALMRGSSELKLLRVGAGDPVYACPV